MHSLGIGGSPQPRFTRSVIMARSESTMTRYLCGKYSCKNVRLMRSRYIQVNQRYNVRRHDQVRRIRFWPRTGLGNMMIAVAGDVFFLLPDKLNKIKAKPHFHRNVWPLIATTLRSNHVGRDSRSTDRKEYFYWSEELAGRVAITNANFSPHFRGG